MFVLTTINSDKKQKTSPQTNVKRLTRSYARTFLFVDTTFLIKCNRREKREQKCAIGSFPIDPVLTIFFLFLFDEKIQSD